MTTASMKPVLARLASGAPLARAEAEAAFELIMDGQATPAQIGAFLMGLRIRGETVDEIAAAATVIRAKAQTIQAPPGAIDTCGTGGDSSGTYNISTAAAIVTAACGVPVAKHGNRAVSSKSGSADVLTALGVNIGADQTLVLQSLVENNLCFLMAPRHHAAMRHVAPVREELGLRTLFNLLGPLSNPAGTRRQLVGVFAEHWVTPIAEVLGLLGAERAWVVHGSDGLDELTVTGPSQVAEWHQGSVTRFEVTPEAAGLARSPADSLRGGDAAHNAAALHRLLDGEAGPYRDVVLLNAGAALVVAGKTSSLSEGVALAGTAIDQGRAKACLARLVEITSKETVN
ncbi:MAG TPA: anthranilate phosphoribosyltransferase [Magnetospirillaceae bacterium]|nr:anthranilate phosphoribosyltransferase [Magnetospirillaceae bacterium]